MRLILRPLLSLLLLVCLLTGGTLYLVLLTQAGPPLLFAGARLAGIDVRAENLEGNLREGVRFKRIFLNGAPLFPAPGMLRLQIDLHAIDAIFRLGENVILLEKKPEKPLQVHASLPAPHLFHPSLRPLKANITLDASVESRDSLNLNGTVGHMRFAPTPGSVLSADGALLHAKITESGLVADACLMLDASHAVTMKAELKGYRLGIPDNKQPLFVKVHAAATVSEVLQKTALTLPVSGGAVDVQMNIGETVGAPDIRARLHLEKVRITPPETGIAFMLPDLQLETHNRAWTVLASLESGERVLHLQGDGALSPLSGSLHVQGEQFPVIKTPEFAVSLSPNLVLTHEQNTFFVRGTVGIPEARIAPMRFQNTVTLSDDVVLVGKETPKSSPLPPIGLDVTATMGEKVEIDVHGLKARLTGSLKIRETPPAPLTIDGELALIDGRYKAYGQNLTLTKGALNFSGADIDNPFLRLRAERAFGGDNHLSSQSTLFDFTNTRPGASSVPENLRAVGVDVQGRLSTPKVQLYSTPAGLTQADMLSMLLLGKPASQANKAGARLLLTALSAMNTGKGAKSMELIQELQQKTGIDVNMQDVARVNRQTGAITESTSLVVGKSIGKRLYLSYNSGLSQPGNNLLTLRYLLNAFLSLQISSGNSANGLDILYTHSGALRKTPEPSPISMKASESH
ncbi:translocation/assembly module TamB domain-containing protein [Legionella geestiana]|uniref:translocation/assembly module TamB domain-containing protein n=1 Tax=Legionella geestiana TaxID=45065 RepID=UPI001651E99E|nr:translocation/assembly module TamB domain-containing protein [Legionella geestiana]